MRLPPPTTGALFVVSGPSGVGKSTLLRHALAEIDGLAFSVSATTRAPRPGEVDGRDYHFMDEAGFSALVGEGALLEHATVYGRRYGTLAAPVEAALRAGRSILLDIDVQGARQVAARRPDAVRVMIAPPDLATLEARLRARGTDDEPTITRRMAGVVEQLGAVGEYDYVVVNDVIDEAQAQLVAVIAAELSRVSRHGARVAAIDAEVRAHRARA